MKRFVVECVWSGYTSSQERPCHREIITRNVEKYERLRSVRFTDNTYMTVTVRPCKPREKVSVQNSYGELLKRAVAAGMEGWISVTDIPPSERELRMAQQGGYKIG